MYKHKRVSLNRSTSSVSDDKSKANTIKRNYRTVIYKGNKKFYEISIENDAAAAVTTTELSDSSKNAHLDCSTSDKQDSYLRITAPTFNSPVEAFDAAEILSNSQLKITISQNEHKQDVRTCSFKDATNPMEADDKAIIKKSTLLKQLQSNLSPKLTEVSTSPLCGRLSRYGRLQKTKEKIDFIPSDLFVGRKSSPVNKSSTTHITYTSKVFKFDENGVITVSPKHNTSATEPYVSPIQKLLQRNRSLPNDINDPMDNTNSPKSLSTSMEYIPKRISCSLLSSKDESTDPTKKPQRCHSFRPFNNNCELSKVYSEKLKIFPPKCVEQINVTKEKEAESLNIPETPTRSSSPVFLTPTSCALRTPRSKSKDPSTQSYIAPKLPEKPINLNNSTEKLNATPKSDEKGVTSNLPVFLTPKSISPKSNSEIIIISDEVTDSLPTTPKSKSSEIKSSETPKTPSKMSPLPLSVETTNLEIPVISKMNASISPIKPHQIIGITPITSPLKYDIKIVSVESLNGPTVSPSNNNNSPSTRESKDGQDKIHTLLEKSSPACSTTDCSNEVAIKNNEIESEINENYLSKLHQTNSNNWSPTVRITRHIRENNLDEVIDVCDSPTLELEKTHAVNEIIEVCDSPTIEKMSGEKRDVELSVKQLFNRSPKRPIEADNKISQNEIIEICDSPTEELEKINEQIEETLNSDNQSPANDESIIIIEITEDDQPILDVNDIASPLFSPLPSRRNSNLSKISPADALPQVDNDIESPLFSPLLPSNKNKRKLSLASDDADANAPAPSTDENRCPSISSDSAKGSSIVDMDMESVILNFKSGQVIWGRIGKFPYWPCIVCPDDKNVSYVWTANSYKIHVRFFADDGRRCWINDGTSFLFNGFESFEDKRKDLKFKGHDKKRPPFAIHARYEQTWWQAIVEAELFLTFQESERVEIFERMILKKFSGRRRSIVSRNLSFDSAFNDNDRRITSTPSIEYDAESAKFNELDLLLTPSGTSLDSNTEFVDFFQQTKNSVGQCCNDGVTEMLLKQLTAKNWLAKCEQLKSKKSPPNKSIRTPSSCSISPKAAQKKRIKKARQSKRQMMTIKNRLTLASTQAETVKQKPEQEKNVSESLAQKKAEEKLEKAAEIEKMVDEEIETYIMSKYPRNHLFRGFNRGFVCALCLKSTNDVVECSGRCGDYVHEQCVKDHLTGRVIKVEKKPRKSGRKSFKTSQEVIHVTGEDYVMPFGDIQIKTEPLDDCEDSAVDIPKIIKCPNCLKLENAPCFVCKHPGNLKSETFMKCKVCNLHYHMDCLKYWPQFKCIDSATRELLCPSHVCHTCTSDDPRGKHYQIERNKLTKCVLCPATYHIDSTCIPAGSDIKTLNRLVCTRHRVDIRKPINANWCFICSNGGELLCCDGCPSSFHLDCLKIDRPDGRFLCEECETGRLPLYGEIVWAKLSSCRWWPAIILPTFEIPQTIWISKHLTHDMCVRFFGSNDFSWISRSFVFLYQKGDSDFGKIKYSSSEKQDMNYQFGLLKAKEWFDRIAEINSVNTNADRDKMLKPQPYVKIKKNVLVPPARNCIPADDEEFDQKCGCVETDADPCGADSGCINRHLMLECSPKYCAAKNLCQNQRFEKRHYPKMIERRIPGKGWGLIAQEDIQAGSFVIEYVGEIINTDEFDRRVAHKHQIKDEHYYFLLLAQGLFLDAGPKGNLSRFINHSCEPNLETQKWQVNGNPRIGFFAVDEIPANTELTFNYNLDCIGNEKKICHCGANKCAGFIGAKYIEPETSAKSANPPKRKKKNKSETTKSKKIRRSLSTEVSTEIKPKKSLKRKISINSIEMDLHDEVSRQIVKRRKPNIATTQNDASTENVNIN